MAAQITDLIDRVSDSTTGRPVISTLTTGGKAIGATSLGLTDATNWTTSSAIHFSIYKKTANGYKDPATQTDWKGVLSGTTITNLTLTGGVDQAYVAGDAVELTPTSRYAKDMYDWGITHANPDGTLKTTAVQSALNILTTQTDWTPLANIPTLSASNGQKEHTLTYTGVDYTDRLQAGTKLRIPRTSTVPTQSGQFVAASSQYASKTSPTGITFTDNYTCEAWVYLNSYQTNDSIFISRSDGVSGFSFKVSSNGQLVIVGRNASNERNATSYQSVPLKTWVHVAGTVIMSSATYTLYINGVSVPFIANNVGSPTAISQAGNLQIGAFNTTNFLDGQIAQARIWSTVRTAAQIRDNANKSLVGNETGLVGYWPLNGSFADLTANANTLTAVAGAIATYADNPWKATEYAIITAATFTGGNTAVTIFSGSNAIPNETLGSSSYSSARAPYGFPTARTRWAVTPVIMNAAVLLSSPPASWSNIAGMFLAVPTGIWTMRLSGDISVNSATATGVGESIALSTSPSAPDAPNDTLFAYANSILSLHPAISRQYSRTMASLAPVYLIEKAYTTGYSNIAIDAALAPLTIEAECAYL